jgi:transposase
MPQRTPPPEGPAAAQRNDVCRQERLPKEITDTAWKAQLRLNAKFKRLVARRVMKTKAVVAVARELAGFVWAIGRQVQTSGWQGVPMGTDAATTH